MNFKPSSDFIFVTNIEVKTPYHEKIIIPGTAKQRLFTGIIKAVGPGAKHKGKVIPINLKENDIVIFGKGVGQEIEVHGEKGMIMREGDIFGVYVGYEE
jgi:chaperonin GroES